MSSDDFHEQMAERKLRADLYELFGAGTSEAAALPHQWAERAVELILSDASPMLTPAVSNALVRREIDWHDRRLAELEAAQIQIGKLERRLDLTRNDRAVAVLNLVRGVYPSRTATHDPECHTKHAACLAAKVRSLLVDEL